MCNNSFIIEAIKMSKYLYILIIFAATLMGGACMKDKGNYTYQSINRITITGIDSTYLVNYGTRLKITPKLAFTEDQQGDTANYSYEWIKERTLGFLPRPKTLATSRELDMDIQLDFGSYYMIYRVTDKRTNVFTDAYFILTVGTPSYEGWLLLCDMENGNGRLDMISHQDSKDTIYPDILKTVGSSFEASGTPVFVETSYTSIPPGGDIFTIFVATSKKFVYLGEDTLEYKPDYDLKNMMDQAEPVTDWTNAQLTMNQSKKGLLVANKNAHLLDSDAFIGIVNNTSDGKRFPISPWVTFDRSRSLNPAVLFDTENGAFYRYPGSGTTCIPYTGNSIFDFNTGKELLYMEYVPFNGGEVFAVLKDKINSRKYLARFTLTGTQLYYGEITSDGIANATQFAVSPDLGYLFYNDAGKIYEYDVINNRSILMKDYGTRTVSLVKFPHFSAIYEGAPNAQQYITLSKKLIVCTYTPGAPTNSGMMDIYDVPDINRPLQLYKSFSGGMGKVVSLAYRDR